MMMRLFPEFFVQNRIAPVAHYPDLLLETLRSIAPAGVEDSNVVVLTPGMYNSAYFEHSANSTGRCNISKFGGVKWGDRGAGARNKPGGQ